jgi:hypothetical protein
LLLACAAENLLLSTVDRWTAFLNDDMQVCLNSCRYLKNQAPMNRALPACCTIVAGATGPKAERRSAGGAHALRTALGCTVAWPSRASACPSRGVSAEGDAVGLLICWVLTAAANTVLDRGCTVNSGEHQRQPNQRMCAQF